MTTISAESGRRAFSHFAEEDVLRLQDSLNRYCRSLAGTRWDAEDLAQDTWVKAIGLLQGDGHPNAEAFLLRIAKNTWIDRSRRKDLLPRLRNAVSTKGIDAAEAWLETDAAFTAVVRHLSPLQRAVFLLRDVMDFSGAETAQRLGTTEGAVKASLSRARQALARMKRDWEDGTLPEPEDEASKTLIRSLAAAYLQGDAARFAELAVALDVLPPITAAGIAQIRASRERKETRTTTFPTARMAA
ncbi:RNA polymerase sigma factor [Cohnella caldifontis]|uniref:RNA polymerase sigma factor n=1 Tax=Cohnella caldifontis TaxID=3027471 RepID=UPI0023EBBC9F|nr:RNA polymerase sigma factor [Cohnella sp. YIM B05605]